MTMLLEEVKQSDSIYMPIPARITAVTTLTSQEKLFTIELPHELSLNHEPGQFVQVSVFGVGEAPISITSSPSRSNGTFELCIRKVGDLTNVIHRMERGALLGIRGPFGRGFQPPVVATRAALAPLSGQMERLRPLLALLLKRGTSIALFAPRPPADLPAEVEVLPLDLLPEAPGWAHFLALDVATAQLGELPRIFTPQSGKRLPCAAEALVLTPLACGGQAECGVCALETSQGWKLACKDGPVFDLNLFLGVK